MKLENIGLNKNLCLNIENLILNGRLPHAILLESGSEKQRRDLSLFLAQAFVCSSDTGPCGKCSGCQKVAAGCHPDVIVTDPYASNEKTFKTDSVRNIRSDAYIMPNEADRKVYILRRADKMNPQAQNAMLKIIEEPPPYARFILDCESKAAMLPTVMSRVTVFSLGDSQEEISDKKKEKADLTAAALAQALMKPNEIEFMKQTAVFEKDKELFEPVLSCLQIIIRDAAVIKYGGKPVSSHPDISKSLSQKFTTKTLLKLAENTENFNECLKQNANKNLLITRFCSVMRSTAYGG
ncbi:MAG: DNA polymerase III subunit delta' C-terminal domain-containing protein [Clostridia bacterium]|nr:DNA polymerase III subunit delta' C-terminal domain-containing protein [Clostridia bacterium]